MSEKNNDNHFPVNRDRLSQLLRDIPYKQTELAEQLYVSDSEISKWKSGERQISERALKKLCQLASCNPMWLLGLEDHRQPNVTWRQMEITTESGKLPRLSQTLLLALLEAVNDRKDPDIIKKLGNFFLDSFIEN